MEQRATVWRTPTAPAASRRSKCDHFQHAFRYCLRGSEARSPRVLYALSATRCAPLVHACVRVFSSHTSSQSIGNLLVLAVSVISIFSKSGSQAKTGVIISQALGTVGLMNWSVRCATEAEQYRLNVLRCEEIETLPTPVKEDVEPAVPLTVGNWAGDIVFDNVGATYKDTPVLEQVSLVIPGGQLTGICGRSGSGKSTLLNSLLGLLDVTEGKISVDGTPMGDLQSELLSRLCYVNQGNGVFPGTLRYNLVADAAPSEVDDVAWRALRLTSKRLHDKLKFFGDSALDVDVAELNLSGGERALIQLARAVANKIINPAIKIVILDEATASVDGDAEKDIQVSREHHTHV